MEPLIELGRSAGPWVGFAVALFVVAEKLGLFRWIMRAHQAVGRTRMEEQARFSADRWKLVETLRGDVEDLRRWRREDKEECDERISALERRDVECREQIALLIRDIGRWRHLVGNLANYIHALRKKMRDQGIEVVPFDGWKKFIEEGGDPGFPLEDLE
jgi:hypothetical protein